MLAEKFHSGKANFKLEFGDLTRLGRIEAKGLTHTSPGQRPGKKQQIFIEGQRPVSHLNFKILIMPMLQSLNQVIVHTCGIDQRGRGTRVTRDGGPMNRAVGARLCYFSHLFLGRCPRLV